VASRNPKPSHGKLVIGRELLGIPRITALPERDSLASHLLPVSSVSRRTKHPHFNYLLAQWEAGASNLRVKNIQVIDGADNCVYDIFAATEEEFTLIFPDGEDIAFNEEVWARGDSARLTPAFEAIWKRRVRKCDAMGIHGVLFYGLSAKSVYYPTRRDEEAINPDGSLLR
jgi:hypothetical protein